MINNISQFLASIRATGLEPPNYIVPGKFYRFPGVGKRNGNTAGWCILFDDMLGGSFGDWSTGLSKNWHAKQEEKYTDTERVAFKEHVTQARALAKKERQAKEEAAASRAYKIWESAKPLQKDHPYLIRKYIGHVYDCYSHENLVKQLNDEIVLPIYDLYGNLTSLQFIKPDGGKRFLTGGRKKDCVIHIKNDLLLNPESFTQQVIICEGWATACTLTYKYPYADVLAAIDANNLKYIALSICETYIDCTLIIAGDDDRLTNGNPGVTKAREAAFTSGALLTLPQWPADAPKSLSDFNDLAVWLEQEDSMRMPF